jgi:cell division protein FtsQ
VGITAKKTNNQNSRRKMTPGERQRLTEKNIKRKKRRMRFVVISTLLIISTVIGGLIYGFFAFFKITEYTVEGATVYTTEQVFENSGLTIGDNLFISDIKSVANRLETNLPYIGKVEIRRIMPGTVCFTVSETTAICAMVEGNGFVLLNKDGKVLEQKMEEPTDGLPILECLPSQNAKIGYTVEIAKQENALGSPLEIYKDLLAAIDSSGMTDITLIDISDTTDVWLTYQERIKMHIGTPKMLESRLVFAAELLKSEDEKYPGQKGELDLTILKTAVMKPETEE